MLWDLSVGINLFYNTYLEAQGNTTRFPSLIKDMILDIHSSSQSSIIFFFCFGQNTCLLCLCINKSRFMLCCSFFSKDIFRSPDILLTTSMVLWVIKASAIKILWEFSIRPINVSATFLSFPERVSELKWLKILSISSSIRMLLSRFLTLFISIHLAILSSWTITSFLSVILETLS
jgi:hypothetical protein